MSSRHLLALSVAALALGIAPTGASPSRSGGGLIAFTASRGSADAIYVATAEGRRIHAVAVGYSSPAWSPNGKRIAYAGGYGIWVANADGTHAVRLTTDDGRAPSWSPDGRQIIYSVPGGTGNGADKDRLFIVGVAGVAHRFPLAAWPYDEYLGDPVYSPDGRQIAFYAEADGGAYAGISLVSATGRHRRMIIDAGFDPAWSPDGRRIAFDTGSGIFIADATGTHQTRLSSKGSHPTWSRDGRRIAFATANGEIWTVATDGTGAHQILKQRGAAEPAWQP